MMRFRKIVEETIQWIVILASIGVLTTIGIDALVVAANKTGPF